MHRELTSEERVLLEARRSRFEAFLHERMPVLGNFMELLELPDPTMVLVEAKAYLPSLDAWLKEQVVDADDRVWIHARLAYFIGEYLVQNLGGHWFLNEIPDSRYFAHYVVGQFSSVANRFAMVDPVLIADACLQEPPGRSLTQLLNSVEQEIRSA